jgi:hypothetical protein
VLAGKLAAVSFTVVSPTQLRAVLPAQPAGTWINIQVVTSGGPSFGNDQTDFRYLAPPKPVVTGLSVHRGKVKEASTVVVSGTDLATATKVTVAGVSVRFTVSGARLTLTVPPHAAASGPVLVTTPNGTSAAAGDATAFTWAA